jgi:hypothetical protein
MNSRVSQLELHTPADVTSSGTKSFPSTSQAAAHPRRDSELDSRNHPLSRLPFYLIGLLLSATAIAKLWMLLTDSFADIRIGLPKEILWLSVGFELWLAFENFRLRDYRVLSLVNTVVFEFFVLFASVRWLMGYTSCGCSGNLELPAWMFILIDFGIVGWFSTTSNQRNNLAAGCRMLWSSWQNWPPEKRGRWAGLIIFGGLVIGMQLPFAAPLRAMIVGESTIIAVTHLDGELFLNRGAKGTVVIHNRSSQPAKIIGISRSCRCFDLTEYPISKTIPANGRLVLPLVIKPNRLGPLHQRIGLFLDHSKQFRVNVDVVSSISGAKR